MKMKLFLLISIITLGVSCKKHEKTEQREFEIEIPDTTKNHQSNISYIHKMSITQELSLNPLENGVDSFELRFWAKVEVLNIGHLYVIKKIKNQWTCLHYRYIEHCRYQEGIDFSEMAKATYIDTFSVKKVRPATNWETFFEKIEHENIYELPPQVDIPGFKSNVADGHTFYVEYATRSKYKFYWFNCPDAFEDTFDECRKMANIVKIFHDEFGLNMGMSGEDRYRCGND